MLPKSILFATLFASKMCSFFLLTWTSMTNFSFLTVQWSHFRISEISIWKLSGNQKKQVIMILLFPDNKSCTDAAWRYARPFQSMAKRNLMNSIDWLFCMSFSDWKHSQSLHYHYTVAAFGELVNGQEWISRVQLNYYRQGPSITAKHTITRTIW